MKKIDYASLYTRRKDGLYMCYYREFDRDGKPTGPRHAVYDRDPARLYEKIVFTRFFALLTTGNTTI